MLYNNFFREALNMSFLNMIRRKNVSNWIGCEFETISIVLI